MSLKKGTEDIFKDKLVFKISKIVVFYKVLSFLFVPELSVFDVDSSNFISNILFADMG